MRSLDFNATFSNETIRRERIFLFFFFCERNSIPSDLRDLLETPRTIRLGKQWWRSRLTSKSRYFIEARHRPLYINDRSILNRSRQSSTAHPLVAFFSPISYLSTTDSLNVNHASAYKRAGSREYISRFRSLATDIRPDRSIQNYRAREKIWEKLEEKWTDRSKL